MVRETRGSSTRDSNMPATPETSKRKRRTSAEGGARGSSSTPGQQGARPSASPAHGSNGEPESKRQRLSHGAANGNESIPEGQDGAENNASSPDPSASGGSGAEDSTGDGVDIKARPARLLSKDVCEAIRVVISQMATILPPKIRNILDLTLPPNFEPKEENTLKYLLSQDDLTWEKLVDKLHLFAEHLLMPMSYPNPVPSLARIHIPTAPLPSHFAPLTLYSFCAALRQLLLQVEPLPDGQSALESQIPTERWALMQKTPGGGLGTAAGEWFTTTVDPREVEAAVGRAQPEEGKTLLETWAAAGDKFGNAQAVIVQTTTPLGLDDNGKTPKLNDAVIRRASLKAQRWKDIRAKRRAAMSGITLHPVAPIGVPAAAGFTPSFAPTYDSSAGCGMGFNSTLGAMHEAARRRSWRRYSVPVDEDKKGWAGVLDAKDQDIEDGTEGENVGGDEPVDEDKPKAAHDATPLTPDEILEANAERIAELQVWQDLRVRKGDVSWITERERVVAEELLDSLTRLVDTTHTAPAKLMSEPSTPGLAHKLAKRLLSTRAPIIRGTLDPRRTYALHDNVTIRLRTQAAAAIAGAPTPLGVNGTPQQSPHQPPPKAVGTPRAPGYMPPPSMSIREPPPHTLPAGTRYYPTPTRTSYAHTPGVPLVVTQVPVQMQQAMQRQGVQGMTQVQGMGMPGMMHGVQGQGVVGMQPGMQAAMQAAVLQQQSGLQAAHAQAAAMQQSMQQASALQQPGMQAAAMMSGMGGMSAMGVPAGYGSPMPQQMGSPMNQPMGQQMASQMNQQMMGSPMGQQMGSPMGQQMGSPMGQHGQIPQQMGQSMTQQMSVGQPFRPPSSGMVNMNYAQHQQHQQLQHAQIQHQHQRGNVNMGMSAGAGGVVNANMASPSPVAHMQLPMGYSQRMVGHAGTPGTPSPGQQVQQLQMGQMGQINQMTGQMAQPMTPGQMPQQQMAQQMTPQQMAQGQMAQQMQQQQGPGPSNLRHGTPGAYGSPMPMRVMGLPGQMNMQQR